MTRERKDDRSRRRSRTRWERFKRPRFRLVFNGWWAYVLQLLGILFYYLGIWAGSMGEAVPRMLISPWVLFFWTVCIGRVFQHKRDYREL